MESARPGPLEPRGRMASIPSGALFGKYEVVRLIGSGGMANVYEAVHVAMKKRVALKVLREEMLAIEWASERFVREGEAAARIQHPNVVDIFDVGTHGGLPYLVMERLEGGSLADLLDRERRLDIQPLLQIILPVCAGVSAGHDRGVIHRDLKPENIFLSADGRRRTVPKVLDFGVSRVLNDPTERLTVDTSVLGTPYYMSPEQARGERTIDARTDQYSLGIVIYEAVVGRLPRDNPSILKVIHEVASGSFPPPRVHRPDLPPAFEAVILRAMSREPKDRFESIRAMAAAFLPFASLRTREYWTPEFTAASTITPFPQRRTDAPMMCTPGIESINPSLPAIEPAQGAPVPAAHPVAADEQPTIRIAPSQAPPAPTVVPLDHVPRRTPRTLSVAVVALLAAAVAIGGPMAWRLGRPVAAPAASAPDARTFEVTLRVVPDSARIELDGNPLAPSALPLALPADGTMHTIRVTAPGFETQVVSFRDAAPPAHVELRPSPRQETPAPVETAVVAPPPRRVPGPMPGRRPTQAENPSAPATAGAPSAAPAEPSGKAADWPKAPGTDNRNPWGGASRGGASK
jgi:eukaryotic-like serine/threonine-protein kinase